MNFKTILLNAFSLVIGSRIPDIQHIGIHLFPQLAFSKKSLHDPVYLFIHQTAGLKVIVFLMLSFIEYMLKHIVATQIRQACIIRCRTQWLPDNRIYTAVESRFYIILVDISRNIFVMRRRCPFPVVIINPEYGFCSMSSAQYRLFESRCDGKNTRDTFCRDFQLITNRRGQQILRRNRFIRIISHFSRIIQDRFHPILPNII